MMDKRRILDAIKQLAETNGGIPPGRTAIESNAGITMSDWYPHFWVRWGEALIEAGFAPNQLQGAYSEELIIQKFIELTRELKKIPVDGELRGYPRSQVMQQVGI